MSIKRIQVPNGLRGLGKPAPSEASPGARTYPGHAHYWERAFSRRNFFATAAGAAGVAVASSRLALPVLAREKDDEDDERGPCSPSPKPIPGGFQITPGGETFHVFAPPGPGTEPSTVTDLQGRIGVAALHGTGTGTDAMGNTSSLFFAADMRFMDGIYVGEDGERHRGTFGFV